MYEVGSKEYYFLSGYLLFEWPKLYLAPDQSPNSETTKANYNLRIKNL